MMFRASAIVIVFFLGVMVGNGTITATDIHNGINKLHSVADKLISTVSNMKQ